MENYMWKTIQCAVQGRGHIKGGVPCQDKTCALADADAGLYAIALADGAGSARLSHYGAATAASYICEEVAESFDDYFGADLSESADRLVEGLLARLAERAAELECEVRELASTLLFVVVSDDRYIAGHIGDGVVGCLVGGELLVLSRPQNGEFANITTFVTSLGAAATMRLICATLEDIAGFVLMSDGTAASLYDKRAAALAPVVASLIERGAELDTAELEEQLAASFREVLTRATTDDCSIALLVRAADELAD